MAGFTERVEYRVTVHHEDGSFWAEVEQLPGCFASGDTAEELQANLVEAMSLYLSTPSSRVKMELLDDHPLEQVSRQQFCVFA